MKKINKKQKALIKIYVVLFVFIYIGMNWESASWIFNYREVGGLVYDFFNPYEENNPYNVASTTTQTALQNALTVNAAVIGDYQNQIPTSPNPSPAPQTPSPTTQVATIVPVTASLNSLQIPSIGITTTVVIGQSINEDQVKKELDKGVVYYPGSVSPGQKGQIVLLGHSAPPNWPHIKHDWVFSDLNNLKEGDQVILHFNTTTYTYKVISKKIIPRGADVAVTGQEADKNILTLVSCWPPGKDYQRIVVNTELVK